MVTIKNLEERAADISMLSNVNTAKLLEELTIRIMDMERKLSFAQEKTNLESIEQINSIIFTHRKSQKLSQSDLADLSGLGYSVIHKVESKNGHPSVKMETLLQITRALGLNVWVG
jgi:DNA-binding transcriptional regulator YiaG